MAITSSVMDDKSALVRGGLFDRIVKVAYNRVAL